MPLSPYLSSLFAGPSNRKRSHDQMSRSESRSESPWNPPPSRTRTNTTPSGSQTNTSEPSQPVPPSARYPGDGFDFRRPVMSTNMSAHRQQRSSPPLPAPTIDLTIDESPPQPAPNFRLPQMRYRRPDTESEGQLAASRERPSRRAPRFGRDIMSGSEFIDLSNTSEEADGGATRTEDGIRSAVSEAAATVSSSPDVEFLSSRPVAPNLERRRRPNPASELFRLDLGDERPGMTHQPLVNAPYLRDVLARGLATGTAYLFGGARATNTTGEPTVEEVREQERLFRRELFEHVSTMARNIRRPSQRAWSPPAPNLNFTADFTDLTMDYENTAFSIVRDSTPPRRPPPSYKAPTPAAEGFTRKVEEEDVVICPNCGDELGTGDEVHKIQVWVAKQCGHVYCGECAINRAITKSGNKKQSRTATTRKTNGFKRCVVEGCDKPVSSRTAMVQIYL